MKRIIIPAGTVSAKKDYILEIPAEPNDRSNEEAIYILDDRGSRASFRSLSDYFYDESENYNSQEYPMNFETQVTAPQMLQNYSYIKNATSDNPFLKSDYKPQRGSNYSNLPPPKQTDMTVKSKYHYYKTLGFTDSEIRKLLSKKNGTTRQASLPRKFMKFNKLGVSDFLSNADTQKSVDYMANPDNLPSNNASVGTYDNMGSVETVPGNAPYATNQVTYQYQGSATQPPQYVMYYETYPNKTASNLDSNVYQQYETRAPVRSNYVSNSFTKPTTSHAIHLYATKSPETNNQRNQQVYQSTSRYYTKSPSALEVNSTSRQNMQNGQQYSQMKRSSSIMKSKIDENEMQPFVKEENYHPYNRRPLRTLPGTSVVSNAPNVKIRNSEYTSNM